MREVSAILFDGLSSAPQPVRLTFDEQKGVIFISTPFFNQELEITNTRIERTGETLTVYFGENHSKYIKINDLALITAVRAHLKQHNKTWYNKLTFLDTKIHVVLSLVFLSAIVLLYFAGVPWMAEKAVNLIPEDYDHMLGTTFFEEYSSQNSVDVEKTKWIRAFAKELDFETTKNLQFTVIKSDEINAFALPDGNIVVFTGLLHALQSPEELVGLMGHESSHVKNRHSLKMLCRNLSGYLFVSAVFSDVNGIMAIIGDNMHNLQSLSFSRAFEKQADQDAISFMRKNKVNLNGMLQLFSKLESKNSIEIPEILSSHPVTKERKKYISALISGQKNQIIQNKNRDYYFKKLKE